MGVRRSSRFSQRLVELDLSTVVPSLAGPSRPQDQVPLSRAKEGLHALVARVRTDRPTSRPGGAPIRAATLRDGTRAEI